MDSTHLVLGLAALFAVSLPVACRVLPEERWQILATVPLRKRADGGWEGVNLTTWGLFTAGSVVVAVTAFAVLAAAAGATPGALVVVALGVLLPTVPASRLVASLVEGKKHTFTVGGAALVGLLLAPAVIFTSNALLGERIGLVPPLATLAALGVAYCFGEGLGRLACISFGCCYGKPVHELGPLGRAVFSRWSFRFQGATKKIAYASGLQDVPVVPIQAITAVIFVAAGLAGTWLLLEGRATAAFLVSLLVSQLWRAASETLRADHRGGGSLTAYQWMSLGGAVWALALAGATWRLPPGAVDLGAGLELLWAPWTIVGLQILWLALFLHLGVSTVTGADISFHVHRDRI